ncbi:GlxA family transcriptional regulator [Mucilaginibacter myungsuensis]|uniref:Helix-turn-helix domain-containing protein n=1 Tax=Mucilaginibacter myungsuensis TaxID=649104 RepID=A0A929L0Q4_9SPHI|nr:helix-turn-helix domain-containing protein [Mucilaginibacter myungsuensis]MBE9663988.1 helix-turn-helix domain-containing protein [Mucilaginibacter myungsuensis]MDN3601167.1 helix-turn-helix domain-containing protein [Mucilaginibacter myungsuensis]
MKHVSILVPLGHTSMPNIDGSHQILSQVNDLLAMHGRGPLFDIQLVGLTKPTVQRNGRFTIEPDVLIGDVAKTDLVIIPAMHGDIMAAVAQNEDFAPWLIKQYEQGAELASLCVGAFLLATTGLLDGKQAATHWVMADAFKQAFPKVDLVDDKIMTEEDGLYTSGGAYSYLNLLVYLVEKHAGRELAIMISKTFMIDIDRISQSPFIIFQGQKAHDDEPVKKAQEYIESNFADKITVDQLADMLALGRRSLERRFKSATKNTVSEYIQRVKIEAAKKSFENSRKNINEVMYDVGYSDTKAFRTIFKKITGLSPIDYRNKYRKDMAA